MIRYIRTYYVNDVLNTINYSNRNRLERQLKRHLKIYRPFFKEKHVQRSFSCKKTWPSKAMNNKAVGSQSTSTVKHRDWWLLACQGTWRWLYMMSNHKRMWPQDLPVTTFGNNGSVTPICSSHILWLESFYTFKSIANSKAQTSNVQNPLVTPFYPFWYLVHMGLYNILYYLYSYNSHGAFKFPPG